MFGVTQKQPRYTDIHFDDIISPFPLHSMSALLRWLLCVSSSSFIHTATDSSRELMLSVERISLDVITIPSFMQIAHLNSIKKRDTTWIYRRNIAVICHHFFILSVSIYINLYHCKVLFLTLFFLTHRAENNFRRKKHVRSQKAMWQSINTRNLEIYHLEFHSLERGRRTK